VPRPRCSSRRPPDATPASTCREKKILAKQLDRQRQVLMKKGREVLDDAADYLSDELHDATKKIVRIVGA
jgi:hypothetical protein